MVIWTKEKYSKFADMMMDKPQAFCAFEILYWCGLRVGELLALTPADVDFEKSTLRVNKSYQRLGSEDIITDPKMTSVRSIKNEFRSNVSLNNVFKDKHLKSALLLNFTAIMVLRHHIMI